jgi:quinol monooxygenase YgiN
MYRFAIACLVCVLWSLPAVAQPRSDAPADVTFYAVSYVEIARASAAQGATALKQYREASRPQDGFVRIEFFEQVGRPGHFAVVETWRDQKAFDARDPAARKRLDDALQPIRVSGYDQRPYKTLIVAPPAGKIDARTVFVVSHVDVTPDPRVAAMLRQLAEASRKDEGNLRFDVMQHMMRANHFTVVEMWQNERALDAHMAAPHTKQYRDELQPLTGSPLDERVYKAIE